MLCFVVVGVFNFDTHHDRLPLMPEGQRMKPLEAYAETVSLYRQAIAKAAKRLRNYEKRNRHLAGILDAARIDQANDPIGFARDNGEGHVATLQTSFKLNVIAIRKCQSHIADIAIELERLLAALDNARAASKTEMTFRRRRTLVLDRLL